MTQSNFRGPLNSMGALEIESGTAATIEPFDGPSGSYQGFAYLDPHALFNKDSMLPGAQPAWCINPGFVTVDAVPQAAGTAILAASQVVTAATPMNLATVAVTNFSSGAASIAVGVPVAVGGTTTVQNLIALDFGFTTGTTTAANTAVQVADNTLFTLGQWIVLGNVANAAGTASLITQVTAISTSNTTTINVLNAPATALGIPIGGANLWGSGLLPLATQFGPSAPAATSASKSLSAGFLRVHNPREFLARNITVTASASTAGTATILVTGYDLYGNLMTELLTALGTTTAFGKKGFKYLANAVPQTIGTTVSANYTLGIGDTFEFPMRADEAEQTIVWAGGTSVPNNVGFTQATTVTPTTNTSADVRGTIQLSALGAGTPISSPATTNNVKRLMIIQSPSVNALVNTTPNNLVPLFGIAQSTT